MWQSVISHPEIVNTYQVVQHSYILEFDCFDIKNTLLQ
jgi:hypothetical protein